MKIAVVALASACLPLLTAADPWKSTSPSAWSDKDVERILTNSPWAKTTSAEMSGGGMPGGGGMGRGGGGGMSRGGGGMRGGGGGAGGPGGLDPAGGGGGEGIGGIGPGGGGIGGGGMGGGPPAMERPQVAVRWQSAEPYRQALRKAQSPHAKQIDGWSTEFYVVSASGMPMMRGGRRGGQDQRPQADPARMEQMQQRMKDATLLKRKGKDPIAPARVELLAGPEGMTMVFLFPRSEAIDADDKEVTLETAFGPMHVKSKFNLKDMIYSGKLAL